MSWFLVVGIWNLVGLWLGIWHLIGLWLLEFGIYHIYD